VPVLGPAWKITNTISLSTPIQRLFVPQPVYCFRTQLERKRGEDQTGNEFFPYERTNKADCNGWFFKFQIMVRYPAWVSKGALKITVTGKDVSYSMPSFLICKH